MPTVGITIGGLSDYIANDKYKLIKVHGSVNWAHEVVAPFTDAEPQGPWATLNKLIEMAPDLKPVPGFHYVGEYPIGNIGPKTVIPALAIPVQTKTDSHFECPQEHLDALRAFLPEVTKILIIGWRGTEAHFLTLLRESFKSKAAVPVMVVAGNRDAAKSICETLGREFTIDSIPADSGFTEFIVRREGQKFLGN